MATVETTKIAPFTGSLCKYCLNFTLVQNYAEDTFETEQLAHMSCAAIPNLTFTLDKATDRYYMGETEYDEEGNMLGVLNNISNCNKFLMGATLLITDVSYDLATTTLTVEYELDNVTGTPDLNFYLLKDTTAIGTVAGVTDGAGSLGIVSAMTDGDYYLWIQLSSGEKSNIYPFNLQTIV